VLLRQLGEGWPRWSRATKRKTKTRCTPRLACASPASRSLHFYVITPRTPTASLPVLRRAAILQLDADESLHVLLTSTTESWP
jgi:hypothetical protein